MGQSPGDLALNDAGAVAPDAPQGTLTSIEFMIVGDTMNFLMGGGNRAWGSAEPCCVNLVIDEDVVRSATGDNNESMTRKEWDVSDLKGQYAQIVVNDLSSGGWGHPNFDDIHQADSGGNIPWAQVTAVEAQGKLAVRLGTDEKVLQIVKCRFSYVLNSSRHAPRAVDKIKDARRRHTACAYYYTWTAHGVCLLLLKIIREEC